MVSLYHTYFTSFFQDCKAVKCGVLSSQCVKKMLCRGEHCSPAVFLRVCCFPEKPLHHQVGGHTMCVPTASTEYFGMPSYDMRYRPVCAVHTVKASMAALHQFSTVLRLDINAVCHVAAPFSGRLKVALFFIVPSFGAAYKGRQCKILPMLRTENSAVAPKLYPCAAN